MRSIGDDVMAADGERQRPDQERQQQQADRPRPGGGRTVRQAAVDGADRSRSPWRSGPGPHALYARFKSATRGKQIGAAILGVVVIAVLGVVAYLLIAKAFSVGVSLGIVITVAVTFSLLGLVVVLAGVTESIIQRRVAKKAPTVKPSRAG